MLINSAGNSLFTARLIGTGNMLLLHPMKEDGQTFLPCCYGHAATTRRAQGSSERHAGRGNGYIGVSRFRSRSRCFLYGKLRQADFLPAGDEERRRKKS